jgi:DNA-binding CsgD family transcriptional regulator
MSLTTERQTLLLRLRRKGYSIASIADQLGLSDSTIRHTLASAYKNLIKEHEAEAAKILELERLDEIQTSFYDIALEGDTKAADVVFKAMDRRAKLLGLDAPERKSIDANIQVGWLEDDEPTTIDGEVVRSDSTGDRPDVADLGEYLVIQESADHDAEGFDRGTGSDQ